MTNNMSINELPRRKQVVRQLLNIPVTICHSALDAESRFSFFWIGLPPQE